MAEDMVWDCIVIGGGIVGSFTGYHLAQAGVKTLIIEQFTLPHTRGSSHGKSRVSLFASYGETLAKLKPEALKLWQKVEKESCKKLYHRTGLLKLETDTGDNISQSWKSMESYGYKYEIYSSEQLKEKYPVYNYPSDYRGYYDPEAGTLNADACVLAVQEQFIKNGGTIHDGRKVVDIENASDENVRISTNHGGYVCKKLVLTPGPWINDLLQLTGMTLPLKTMPGCVCYWKSLCPSKHSGDAMPVIIDRPYSGKQQFYYAIPINEYPGMIKIVTRGEVPQYCHPDARDEQGHDGMIRLVAEYIKKYIPDVEDKPSIIEPCMYTMSPDHQFVIDAHPHHSNIVIGAGFSGSGFQYAPVIGKILATMVQGQELQYDITSFKIERFGEIDKLFSKVTI